MRLIVRRFALVLVLSTLANPGVAQAAGEDGFVDAAAQYEQQHWQVACDAFQKLLDAEPEHPRIHQARFYYGEALAQLGRYSQARAQFAELLKRDPDNRYARGALFRSAEAAYLAGEDRAAEQELQAFRDRYPNDDLNAYTLPYLANLQLQSGHAEAAKKLFSTALAEFKDGPLGDECRLGLAQAQEHLGELAEARAGYRALIEIKSRLSDQAMLHLGTVDNALGDYAAAEATLAPLTSPPEADRLQGPASLARGYALYKLGRYPEAEELLGNVRKDPQLGVEAHYWLGLSQQARSAWSEAAQTFEAAEQSDPKHRLAAALSFQAGDALLHLERYKEARDHFGRVLTEWPDSSWADESWLGNVQVAVGLNEYAEVLRLAEEFTKKFTDSPLTPQAELAKGRALVALSRYGDAIGPLNIAIEHEFQGDSKSRSHLRAEAGAALVVAYAKLQRFSEAQQSLDRLGAEEPGDELLAPATYSLAEAAYEAGEMSLACELFDSLSKLEKSPVMVSRGLAGLGWCRFKADQWTEAAHCFERVLNEYPSSPAAAEAALMRGRALEQLEQFAAALAMYRVVIDRYAESPRVVDALWYAGRLHDQLEQPREAIELYTTLVSDHPDFIELDAVLYRWAALLRASDPTAADTLLERLRKDFPNSRYASDAKLRLAEHAVADQKYDDGEQLLAELNQPQSTNATRQHAWYLQGRMAMSRRQWAEAERSFAQVTEHFPDCELALPSAYLMAETSYRQGNFEQAVERLAVLAAKTKGHEQSWSATAQLRRAQALAQLKEWHEALEIASSMATEFPNFNQQYEVDYLIGRCLAAGADFAAAREAYAKVIGSPHAVKSQTAAMARWMIGETYFHQEDYGRALAEYQIVERDHAFPRWQSAAVLQQGKCYERLGQWRAAADAYSRLVKTYANSEFSDEASRLLAVAEQRAAAPAKLK